MRLLLPVAALLVFAQPALAQTALKLHGVVVDESGSPIPLVKISLTGSGATSTTTTGGFLFDLPVDKVGTSITLQIAKSGWKPHDSGPLTFIVPRDSTANPLRIIMVPARLVRAELKAAPPPGYLNAIVRVDGLVARMLIKAGDDVQRGQTIAILDSREYVLAMERARLEVQKYEAGLSAADAKIATLRPAVSSDPSKQIDLDLAQGQRDDLYELLGERRVSLRSAQTALAFTRVIAPGCGRVKAILVRIGDMMHAGENSVLIDQSRGCVRPSASPSVQQ